MACVMKQRNDACTDIPETLNCNLELHVLLFQQVVICCTRNCRCFLLFHEFLKNMECPKTCCCFALLQTEIPCRFSCKASYCILCRSDFLHLINHKIHDNRVCSN